MQRYSPRLWRASTPTALSLKIIFGKTKVAKSPNKKRKKKEELELLISQNGKHYYFKEAFLILDDLDITTNKFGKLATESNNFQSSPRLLCHRGVFCKRLKQYQTDGVIPNNNILVWR